MLAVEYDLLKYIHENQPCTWIDVLNHFNPESCCNFTDELLRLLLHENLIATEPPANSPPICSVCLQQRTIRLLAQFEQNQREKEKAAKKNKREKYQDHLFSVFIAFFSAFLGFLFAHFEKFIDLLLQT